jgi:hypothetical protein
MAGGISKLSFYVQEYKFCSVNRSPLLILPLAASQWTIVKTDTAALETRDVGQRTG